MQELTRRQQEIYEYICSYYNEHHTPPSIRDIMTHCGLASPSPVQKHIQNIAALGYIQKDEKGRIYPVQSSTHTRQQESEQNRIPLLGNVAAGVPILAEEHIEAYYPFDRGDYALRIQGTSMINAGIFDGDIALIEQTSVAHNGEIIIAMTEENEATCKRFYKRASYIELVPENDELEPMQYDTITILGRVVGIYREF